MPITEKQRANRRKYIGSSDMAAVLGRDPYATAYDVWLHKTGKLSDEDEDAFFTANPAALDGIRFEGGVILYAEDELGKIRRNQRRLAPEIYLAANVDGLVMESGEPVEAKTAGMRGPLPAGWGDEGTGIIPKPYIIQAHCHMIVTGKQVCHVPAFLGGKGFRLYRVERNQDLDDIIRERAIRFWERCVLADIPPADVAPSLDLMKRVIRVPKTVATIPIALHAAWEEAKAEFKVADKAKKSAQAMMIAAMGDADAATFDGGPGAITYYEETKKGFTVKESKSPRLRYKKKGLPK